MRKLLALCIALAAIMSGTLVCQALTTRDFIVMFPPRPEAGGGGGPLTFSFGDSSFITGAPATPVTTWNGGKTTFAVGTLTSDSTVVVDVAWGGTAHASNTDITDVRINGSAATQAVYSRPGAGGTGHAQWFLPIASGTTVTVSVGGYVSGWVDNIVVNVGVIKGSTTTSVASTTTGAAYSNGGNATAVTVPANGLSIISGIELVNSSAAVMSWGAGVTLDNDQWDGINFSFTGSMAHLSTSTTITASSGGGGGGQPFGWVAANYQP